METSISKLIESFDSFISKNRSPFSVEDFHVINDVRHKLSKLIKSQSNNKQIRRREIINSMIFELLKLLIDPKIWDQLKNLF